MWSSCVSHFLSCESRLYFSLHGFSGWQKIFMDESYVTLICIHSFYVWWSINFIWADLEGTIFPNIYVIKAPSPAHIYFIFLTRHILNPVMKSISPIHSQCRPVSENTSFSSYQSITGFGDFCQFVMQIRNNAKPSGILCLIMWLYPLAHIWP